MLYQLIESERGEAVSLETEQAQLTGCMWYYQDPCHEATYILAKASMQTDRLKVYLCVITVYVHRCRLTLHCIMNKAILRLTCSTRVKMQ